MGTLAERLRFEVVESPELRSLVHKLRYAVYVREFEFENATAHRQDFESDDYDDCSIHIAAIDHGVDGKDRVIGTIRLVLHSPKGFPIEHAVATTFIGDKPLPGKIAEISRLCVDEDLRRRQGDGLHGVESYLKVSEGGILPEDGSIPEEYKRRVRPILVLGLYKKMYHVSKRLGITHWYMITEKKLWYALKRYGFVFHQIGEEVEYHGRRIPYLGIIAETEENLIANHPDFLRECLEGLEQQFWPEKMLPATM